MEVRNTLSDLLQMHSMPAFFEQVPVTRGQFLDFLSLTEGRLDRCVLL